MVYGPPYTGLAFWELLLGFPKSGDILIDCFFKKKLSAEDM